MPPIKFLFVAFIGVVISTQACCAQDTRIPTNSHPSEPSIENIQQMDNVQLGAAFRALLAEKTGKEGPMSDQQMGQAIRKMIQQGASPNPAVADDLMEALGGRSRDLNAKVQLNPIASTGKKQVMVYIANEPNAVAGRRVAGWLANDPEKLELRKWLLRDIEKFPALVEQEISEIRQHTPVENGAAIFTNKLIRQGLFLGKAAGDTEYKRFSFVADAKIETLSQPLTNQAVFSSVAKNLAAKFPTSEHQFLVVSKSHGTDKFVVATVMGQLFDAESRQEAFEILEKNAIQKQKKARAGKPSGKLGNNFNGGTLGADFRGDTLGGKLLTTGFAKEAFIEALQVEGDRLEIPLLFLESCRSQMDAAQMRQLKGDRDGTVIGSLYTSDKTGLRFTTIDYRKLFQNSKRLGGLTEGFVQYLDDVQAHQIPIPEKSKIGGENAPADSHNTNLNHAEETHADSFVKEKEKLVGFLKENVIGRVLKTSKVSKIDGGKVESNFQRKTVYCNLKETQRGFSFDICYSIEQTLQDLDDEGNNTGEPRVKDRVLTFRHEYVIRRSTGKAAGIARLVSISGEETFGTGFELGMELQEDKLVESMSTIGYSDSFSKGGSFRPTASRRVVTYENSDNLLMKTDETTLFEIDRETMQKTKATQQPEARIEKEGS